MRRTAFFVLAASFSLSAVGIAFSGDLSQRYAPPAYPPPQPVYDWNRCYGGLNAGGVWSPGIDAFGFTGGGQIGCNWQWYNSFVWGGEADLQYTGLDGRIIGMTTGGASAPLKELQKKFGFHPEEVVVAAKELLGRK